MHYYSFNIGDYHSHTSRLSLMEDLAYRRLLDLYYLNERPFTGTVAEVAREIGMNDRLTDVEFVLNRYFPNDGEKWVNKRADIEIANYQGKKKNASKAGKASAKARKQAASEQPFNDRSTTVQPTNNHKPITNNHKPLTNINNTPFGFDTFWAAYPRKTQKKNALKAWGKLKPDQTLLDLITKNIVDRVAAGDWSEKQFIPHPATYLNQERWKDEIVGDAKIQKPPPDYSKMAQEVGDPFDRDDSVIALEASDYERC